MTATSNPTASHLAPENCFICGSEEHPDTAEHRFWSNADARAEARERDRRTTHVYPGGHTTREAAYVAEHRPY